MKKYSSFLLIVLICLSGCTNTSTVSEKPEKNKDVMVADAKEKMAELEKELETAKNKLVIYEKEKEHFAQLSNLSRDFVRAQTRGEIDKLNTLIADHLSVSTKEDEINITNQETGTEWLLFSPGKRKYDDMVIQGYGYDEQKQTMIFHIRQFYLDQNNKPEEGATFLNLIFKQLNGEWKVIDLYFDI